ncbi:hypothetical protein [Streptomyces sp. JV180]|uniref:hypothetical protein n=1 Tax=Streptomyces sp. JV180 TaxID=858634 RepID=UPI00168BC4BE|nr:hypothetical protein [Streptomyces sp. JV180]MBD3549992.1 hypothetical protein [Streptomyces sp. JV180]
MIRLPSTHAAITAPLVASSSRFPGIPIGRSLLDGRPFHLSPVLVSTSVLPSTNSLALGGLGSGKSTTAKTRMLREIDHHNHQVVVIDSFGEDATGEWAAVTRAMGGCVIDAAEFTLNPLSPLLPPEVREQLVRSLILAVEPAALTPQATHALQHGLNSAKATSLRGLVDALTEPEDGRWAAARLSDWGEGAAIALSRYTEGSLRGLFDSDDAGLPPTDLPIVSFDFSRLDRNSPAIPSLMAAVTCWVEHVWLPQSTAVHRHLVLEEAWQILLSPATAELIQRLLKNSRKAALSLDVVMHTLSDLGEGKAQDLARLCEIAHVGRLGPEEAAIVGALLGLPDWAVARIPRLGPGEAVWRVGPDYVDVVATALTDEEARLTDTSARRRQAQEAHTRMTVPVEQDEREDQDQEDQEEKEGLALLTGGSDEDDWTWDMPPNLVDIRHETALRAAQEGRCSEAADIAALGEREDIAAHGINSPQAMEWISTRALVADLCGTPGQAAQLRATVARMGIHDDRPTHEAPPDASTGPSSGRKTTKRRILPVALVGALGLALAFVWAHPGGEEAQRQQRDEKAAASTAALASRVGVPLSLDGVDAVVEATWSDDGKSVVVALHPYYDQDKPARYLRIDAHGQTASHVRDTDAQLPKDPELALSVSDPAKEVTVRVLMGGASWTPSTRAYSRTLRLSPLGNGKALDAKTGKELPVEPY